MQNLIDTDILSYAALGKRYSVSSKEGYVRIYTSVEHINEALFLLLQKRLFAW